MNAWWCACGAHGIESSQPATARALESHLVATGHRGGEYFYGCPAQRTAVAVRFDDDDRLRHDLVPP